MHPLRERILSGATCTHLRTKGMFVAGHDGPPPEVTHAPDTAAFWCVKSGWAGGPDGLPANLERCARGRECFRSDVEV